MEHIIDTQCFLWFIQGDDRLSERGRAILNNADNINYLSVVSIWEMSIKIGLSKLSVGEPFTSKFISDMTKTFNMSILYITVDDVIRVHNLPLHHRDPFDRLLIAQALENGMPILSSDSKFDAYAGINRVFD
jgi:PIN domain nuclease of toxin-antitoxin system